MKRLFSISSALLFVATALQAAPAPDFWYVVTGDATSAEVADSRMVQGIVVPTTVQPTIQTTPSGSIIVWRRPDGTRQSFVMQGMSSFTFEPGPMANTTQVLFSSKSLYPQLAPRCCSCASWMYSRESVERLACVAGCSDCACVGCVCSPGTYCPLQPDAELTLVAHDDPGKAMTFAKANGADSITLGDGDRGVQFRGQHVTATLSPAGETVIHGSESITLPGAVENRARVRDDKALFAWSSPHASVILEQPRSLPAPSFHDETIDLIVPKALGQANSPKRPTVAPLSDECSVCGTHPNSKADLDIFDCVPGDSVCYRCITWTC